MKPKVPADTKALQALRSELRHLENKLAEWEADLADREEMLREQQAAFEAALDGADDATVQRYADNFAEDDDEHGADCGCDGTDAGAGCDCPKCQNTRAEWVGGVGFSEMEHPQGFKVKAQRFGPKPVGDEIKWLENLWKLKDNRKKR